MEKTLKETAGKKTREVEDDFQIKLLKESDNKAIDVLTARNYGLGRRQKKLQHPQDLLKMSY